MRAQQPILTIGLPVYNGGDFIAKTVESILSQSFRDFHLVVSDNCSTDSTEAVCREFERRDSRVTYQRNPRNVGASENYNKLFRESSGPYFKWAAADDVMEPDFLARCLSALEADPTAVLAFPQAMFIDGNGDVLEVDDPRWNLSMDSAAERLDFVIRAGHWCNAMFAVMRRDALAQTHLHGSYPGGDYRLLGELAVLGRFYEVPEKLFRRRLHAEASSQNLTLGWQMMFYTPHRPLRFCVPTLLRQLDHLRTVVGSDLVLADKLRLAKRIGRALRWGRVQIYGEFTSIIPQIWHRVRRRSAAEAGR